MQPAFLFLWDYFIMQLQRKVSPDQDYICSLKSQICHLEPSDQKTFSVLGNEMYVLCAMVKAASLSTAICTILLTTSMPTYWLVPITGTCLCQVPRWHEPIRLHWSSVYKSWKSHPLFFRLTAVFPALWMSAGRKMAEQEEFFSLKSPIFTRDFSAHFKSFSITFQ